VEANISKLSGKMTHEGLYIFVGNQYWSSILSIFYESTYMGWVFGDRWNVFCHVCCEVSDLHKNLLYLFLTTIIGIRNWNDLQ
jgi:hypothetical protein